MTKDEALRLAWDALEDIGDEWGFTSKRTVPKRKEAIAAIKEALDECDEDELIIRYHEMTIKRLEKRIEELTAQPEQEPVAWEQFHEHLVGRYFCSRCGKRVNLTTIHTCTPPQENT